MAVKLLFSHLFLLLCGFYFSTGAENADFCRENIGEALGTSDYLLYGLTAECDVFFARNVPNGTDLSEYFGPKAFFNNATDGPPAVHYNPVKFYQCARSRLLPIRNTNGTLKLLLVGEIVRAGSDVQLYPSRKIYIHVFDVKIPKGRNWFTTTKLVDCEHQAEFKWEKKELPLRFDSSKRRLPTMDDSLYPIGEQCQFGSQMSRHRHSGETSEEAFFVHDQRLFHVELQRSYKGKTLTWEDWALNVHNYTLEANGTLLNDNIGRLMSRPPPVIDTFGWKLIRKSWDPLAVQLTDKDEMAARKHMPMPYFEMVIEKDQLCFIGAEKMRCLNVTRALSNPNALYSSQPGVDHPAATSNKNTSTVRKGENYRVRQRQLVNGRMMLVYDHFDLDGIWQNDWKNESTEVWVMDLVEVGEGDAKCIARISNPDTKMGPKSPALEDVLNRGGLYSFWNNFQVGALVGKDYEELMTADA